MRTFLVIELNPLACPILQLLHGTTSMDPQAITNCLGPFCASKTNASNSA